MVTPEVYFFLAVLVGVLTRTFLPYLKKKRDAKGDFSFDPTYAWTAVYAIITAFVEVMVLLAGDPYALVDLSPYLALLSGFFFGMGNNELWNRILG